MLQKSLTARKKWPHMQQDSDLAVAVCAVLDRDNGMHFKNLPQNNLKLVNLVWACSQLDYSM